MPAILLFFIETKLGRTIAISAAIVIGIGVGWLTFSNHYFNKGWTAALHAVAAQDAKAISEAQHAREAVKQCRDGGGTWDVSNGVCG
jgi:hypothetical protein